MSTENATNYECELAHKLKGAICHILQNFGLIDEADNWRVENNRVFLPLELSIVVRHYPAEEYQGEETKYICTDYNYSDQYYESATSAIKWAVEKSLNIQRKAEVAAQLFFPELFEV